MDGGQEMDCWPIVGWIFVALKKKARDENSTLAMKRSTVPLANRDLLHHHHNMLTCHLPGQDPNLQRVQRSIIATHFGEVRVKWWQDREAKSQAQKEDDDKGIP